MNDRDNEEESTEPGWLERLGHFFSSEPRTRQDVRDMLQVAADNEIIDHDALSIIDGALKVSSMQAREIMVPRPQMEIIKLSDPLEDVVNTLIKTGHSRYPVIDENPDEIIGILLAKDLLPRLTNESQASDELGSLRPAVFVPESKRVNVLLREFRENRNHMAIVIDEYGGVAGLITIEDVLEEIVGEIEDEFDVEADSFIRKIADNDFVIKALTPIDEFNEHFKAALSDDEYDTVGGLLLGQFGHLPARNEITQCDNFEFKVINADSRQIHLLRMRQV